MEEAASRGSLSRRSLGALDDPSPTASNSTLVSSHHAAIREALAAPVVDIEELRKQCWFGCPCDARLEAWCVLSEYVPATTAARVTVRDRRRREYRDYVSRHYTPHNWSAVLEKSSSPDFNPATDASVGSEELLTIRQVRKDVPRTSNGVPLLAHPAVQQLLERLLFTWAVRHPASGYVQGMNDLVLPFLFVSLADALDGDRKGMIPELLSMSAEAADAFLRPAAADDAAVESSMLLDVEADTYWLSATFLRAVQDNFTVNQTGAHAMVAKLEQVLKVTDPALTMHLEELGIRFPEFAFRWMNCFLLRELSAMQGVRVWDTYLCDLDDFAELHVYMCAAMLRLWTETITRSKDFVSVMHFLQNPPTRNIDPRGIDELCSSAFLLQQLYRPTLGGLSQPDGMGSRGSEPHFS